MRAPCLMRAAGVWVAASSLLLAIRTSHAWVGFTNEASWLAAVTGTTLTELEFGVGGWVTDVNAHLDQGIQWSTQGDSGTWVNGMGNVRMGKVCNHNTKKLCPPFTSLWRMDFVDPITGAPRGVKGVKFGSITGGSARIIPRDENGNKFSPSYYGGTNFRGIVAEEGEAFYSITVGSSAAHSHQSGPITYALEGVATTTTSTTTTTTVVVGGATGGGTTTTTLADSSTTAGNEPPAVIFGGSTFTGPTSRVNLRGYCTCPIGGGLSIVFTVKIEPGGGGSDIHIIEFGNAGSNDQKIIIGGTGGSTLLIAMHYTGSWHNYTIPNGYGTGSYDRYLITLGSGGTLTVYKNGGSIGSTEFGSGMGYGSRDELWVGGINGFVGGLMVFNRVVGWAECEVIPFRLIVVGSTLPGAGSGDSVTIEYRLTGGGSTEWITEGSGSQVLFTSTCEGCTVQQDVLLPGWPGSVTLTILGGGDSWGYKEIYLGSGAWDVGVNGGGGGSVTVETRYGLSTTYEEVIGLNPFWLCTCEEAHTSQTYYFASVSGGSSSASLLLAGREFTGDTEDMYLYCEDCPLGSFSLAFTARWDSPGTIIHFGGPGEHQIVLSGGSGGSLLAAHQYVGSDGLLTWGNLSVSSAFTTGESARFLWKVTGGGLSELFKAGNSIGSLQVVAPSTAPRTALVVGGGGFQGRIAGLGVWKTEVDWSSVSTSVPHILTAGTSSQLTAGTATGARVRYSVGGQWTVPQLLMGSASVSEAITQNPEFTTWPGYVKLIAQGADNWGLQSLTLSQGSTTKALLNPRDNMGFGNNLYWLSTGSPDDDPNNAPAERTYCVPGIVPCSSAARGDPHVVNMLGQRFDIRRLGVHTLLHIPKGVPNNRSLLDVQATIFGTGTSDCGPAFIQTLSLTGKWAYHAHHGGFRFDASMAKRYSRRGPVKLKLGPVQAEISFVQRRSGVQYLDVVFSRLDKAAASVGGLLGVDDHQWASQNPKCPAPQKRRRQKSDGFLALHRGSKGGAAEEDEDEDEGEREGSEIVALAG